MRTTADVSATTPACQDPPILQFSLLLTTCNYSVDTPYISQTSTTSHPTAKFITKHHYKLVFALRPKSFCCVATAVCCGTIAYKEFKIEDSAFRVQAQTPPILKLNTNTGTSASSGHFNFNGGGTDRSRNIPAMPMPMPGLFTIHPIDELELTLSN